MNVTQRQSILDAIVEFEKADFNTPFQNKPVGGIKIAHI